MEDVTIISSVEVKGPYLRIHSDTFNLPLPNGSSFQNVSRDFLKSKNAVSILVYSGNDNAVLLLRQYRHPVFVATGDIERAWIYETVAGTLKEGEDPLLAAVREIEEETGLKIHHSRLTEIHKMFSSPGISSEIITLYLADIGSVSQVQPGGLAAECEYVVPEWVSYDEIVRLVSRGKIEDAKTLLSLARMRLV